jgi:uncharacterized membrane protein YdjX (TVP38/TMEM64 family)
MPATAVLDLERPVEQARPRGAIVPSDIREPAIHGALRTLRSAAVLAAVLLAWSWLVHRLEPGTPMAWFVDTALMPVVVIVAFLVGGALMLPTSLLVLATMLLLGPSSGLLSAVAGLAAAGVVGWIAGRLAWRRGVRRIAGPHVERIARRLGTRRDIRALAGVRLFPIAPFTVVSIVCGGLGVRLDRFVVATLLGTLPSLVILALLVYALGG